MRSIHCFNDGSDELMHRFKQQDCALQRESSTLAISIKSHNLLVILEYISGIQGMYDGT